MIEFLKRQWSQPTPLKLTPLIDSTLQERLKVTGSACKKCGGSFALQPPSVPAIKYANDQDHGERLLITCWQCGYKWAKPIKQ